MSLSFLTDLVERLAFQLEACRVIDVPKEHLVCRMEISNLLFLWESTFPKRQADLDFLRCSHALKLKQSCLRTFFTMEGV
jgi:hypothetical protein